MENSMAGGFTPLRSIVADEKELFISVMDRIVGASHKPLAVATQVVNGTNYAYLCETTLATLHGESYNTLVIIHKPLPNVNEPPTLLEIKRIKVI